MSNEFEWRNQMRKLGGAVEPANDLWPQIAARLADVRVNPPVLSRPRHRWAAIAASLVVAGGAAFTAFQLQHMQGSLSGPAVVQQTPAPSKASVGADSDEILRFVREHSDAEQDARRLQIAGLKQ